VLLGANVSIEQEDAFFRRLALSNGTFKTTRRGRLVDVDAWLLERLTPGQMSLDLLDVAVSSGVTTAELIRSLRERGIEVRTVAMDLMISASLISVTSLCDLLCDASGNPLELRLGGFVKGRPHDLRSPRRLLGWAVISAVALGVRGVRAAGAGSAQGVYLLSSALRHEVGVTLREADLFHVEREWIGRFDLVRAANILNRAYFEDPRLLEAIATLTSYLRPDGLLLVARSDDDEQDSNRATLFRRNNRGTLDLLATYNGGSEIDQLVLDARP
jgi:hypothetical protein